MIHRSKVKLVNLGLAFILALGCIFAAGLPTTVYAAAQGLSSTYTQNFDGLPATGSATWSNDSTLPGWYASRTSIIANNGTSTAGGVLFSYGSSGSTERAFGAIPKKNAGGTIYKGVLLRNDTLGSISELYIAYAGEQWHNSAGGTQTLAFSYQVSATAITNLTNGTWTPVTALDFRAPITGGTAGALDGNLAANQRQLSNIISVNIPTNHYIMLRWVDSDDRGADHGLAMDDLVVSRNLPPSAAADAFSTAEDTPLTISAVDLLANDSDPENDPLTAVLATQAAHGLVATSADGGFTYTPAADWSGNDSFTYYANDGNLNSPAAVVTLTVSAANDDPAAGDQTLSTDEDTPLNGALTATDIDSTTLTFAKESNPTHGTVTVDDDGAFTYTPEADFNGSDSFTFTVSDGHGGSDSGTISITIDPVNDPPVAAGQTLSTDEDQALDGALTATDADGDSLTFAKGTDPLHGIVSVDDDGTFTYTPEADFNGSDSFTFTVSDGHGGSDSGTITISVGAINDAPVAAGQALSTDEDEVLDGTLSAVDADGDSLTFAKESDPLHGTVSVNDDGAFTYTPDADFNGSDSFTFTVGDGNGGSDSGAVTLTIDPVNDAPNLLNALPDQTHPARTPYSFDGSAYFADIDSSDVLIFSAEFTDGSPLPAWLNFDPDSGILSGSPTNAEIGSYAIRILASDGSATAYGDFELTVGQNQFQLFIPIVLR